MRFRGPHRIPIYGAAPHYANLPGGPVALPFDLDNHPVELRAHQLQSKIVDFEENLSQSFTDFCQALVAVAQGRISIIQSALGVR